MVEIAGARAAGFSLPELRSEWKSFWYSFWGLFGAFNILAGSWFYALTGALSLIGAAGLLLAAGRLVAKRSTLRRWRTHVLLVTFLALTALGLLRWTLMTPASQGRLMFSGIAAIALYLAIGLLAWFPRRWHIWLSRGLAVALVLVAAIVPLTALLPAYRPSPTYRRPAGRGDRPRRSVRRRHRAGWLPAERRHNSGRPAIGCHAVLDDHTIADSRSESVGQRLRLPGRERRQARHVAGWRCARRHSGNQARSTPTTP